MKRGTSQRGTEVMLLPGQGLCTRGGPPGSLDSGMPGPELQLGADSPGYLGGGGKMGDGLGVTGAS